MNNVKKCSWSKRRDCRALSYLNDVLETSEGVIDAVTWHQYYLNGRTATVKDFLEPKVLNRLKDQMDMVADSLQRFKHTGTILLQWIHTLWFTGIVSFRKTVVVG